MKRLQASADAGAAGTGEAAEAAGAAGAAKAATDAAAAYISSQLKKLQWSKKSFWWNLQILQKIKDQSFLEISSPQPDHFYFLTPFARL